MTAAGILLLKDHLQTEGWKIFFRNLRDILGFHVDSNYTATNRKEQRQYMQRSDIHAQQKAVGNCHFVIVISSSQGSSASHTPPPHNNCGTIISIAGADPRLRDWCGKRTAGVRGEAVAAPCSAPPAPPPLLRRPSRRRGPLCGPCGPPGGPNLQQTASHRIQAPSPPPNGLYTTEF